jgi:hypothetical protein
MTGFPVSTGFVARLGAFADTLQVSPGNGRRPADAFFANIERWGRGKPLLRLHRG